MRSTVFLLMFAVCLVAWECAANAEEEKAKKGTDDGQTGSTSLTHTVARQTTGVSSPEQFSGQQSDLEPSLSHSSPASAELSLNSGNTIKPADLPTDQSKLEQQSTVQHQEPPQQAELNDPKQGTPDRQQEHADAFKSEQDAALTSRTDDGTERAEVVTLEKTTDTRTDQNTPDAPEQDSNDHLSSSSHSTGTVLQQTGQKSPTPTTTIVNTIDGITSPGTTNTDRTQAEHNNAQVSERITPSQTSVLPDITKKAHTTEKPPTKPISPQTPQSTTTVRGVNTQDQTLTGTRQTSSNPLQTDQYHAKPTLQTSPGSKGHSPDKHLPKEKVVTPPAQPEKQQTSEDATTRREQSHSPAPKKHTMKSKEDANNTTLLTPKEAHTDNKNVAAKNTTTNSTADADNTVHHADTTTQDKETNPMQISVSSTSEPEKGETTLPGNTSQQLSKALQSLDNKDSSIGGSLVCALAALATLVLVAVAPAS